MKSSPPEFLPLARSEEIITKRIDGELLVYNRLRDEAHCLNETAAAIWKCCDGRTTANEIAELLSKKTGSTIDEKVIWLGLDELRRKHLLMETRANPERATRGLTLSRREAIRRIGLGAAIALPVIVTITAPTPAQAGTCKHNNVSCSTGSECCSGVCNPGAPPKCVGG
ncbi:MAG TPA: PqqD family protein [Pyrinomonadaceae bacterium]|nr:PqqD family protein [Pyrinomonadaceae bacterium]